MFEGEWSYQAVLVDPPWIYSELVREPVLVSWTLEDDTVVAMHGDEVVLRFDVLAHWNAGVRRGGEWDGSPCWIDTPREAAEFHRVDWSLDRSPNPLFLPVDVETAESVDVFFAFAVGELELGYRTEEDGTETFVVTNAYEVQRGVEAPEVIKVRHEFSSTP